MANSSYNPVLMNFKHQEALDLAYDWYVTDGNDFSRWAESNDPTRGRIRGDNGARCPIGLLISDEEYACKDGEESSVLLSGDDPVRLLVEYNFEFLNDLSSAHDRCLDFWDQGYREDAVVLLKILLGNVATKWHLENPNEPSLYE